MNVLIIVLMFGLVTSQQIAMELLFWQMPGVADKYQWNISDSACNWSGVTCSPTNQVIAIDLQDVDAGPNTLYYIDLSGLAWLTRVVMRNLSIEGDLVTWMFDAPHITYLDIAYNKVYGDLSSVNDAATYIDVTDNLLNGRIFVYPSMTTLLVGGNDLEVCNLNVSLLQDCVLFPQSQYNCEGFYYCTVCSPICPVGNLTVNATSTTIDGNYIAGHTTITSGGHVTFDNCTFVDLGVIELQLTGYHGPQAVISSDCPLNFTLPKPVILASHCSSTQVSLRYDSSQYTLWLEGSVVTTCTSKTWVWIVVGVAVGLLMAITIIAFVVRFHKPCRYWLLPYARRREVPGPT